MTRIRIEELDQRVFLDLYNLFSKTKYGKKLAGEIRYGRYKQEPNKLFAIKEGSRPDK